MVKLFSYQNAIFYEARYARFNERMNQQNVALSPITDAPYKEITCSRKTEKNVSPLFHINASRLMLVYRTALD